MSNRRLLVVLCFVFVCACDEQNSAQEVPVEQMKAIDMSKSVVDQRWFEEKFLTQYDKLKNIDGGCVSWGMSGQCWYRFAVLDGVAVESKEKYEFISCDEVYEKFVEQFNNDEGLRGADRLVCRKASFEESKSYWVSVKLASKHYVWDIFENKEGKQ